MTIAGFSTDTSGMGSTNYGGWAWDFEDRRTSYSYLNSSTFTITGENTESNVTEVCVYDGDTKISCAAPTSGKFSV